MSYWRGKVLTAGLWVFCHRGVEFDRGLVHIPFCIDVPFNNQSSMICLYSYRYNNQWCRWGSFHETEAEAELTMPRRGKAEAEAGGSRPRQNVRGRGKAVRKQCKCLSYRRNYVAKNWKLKIMLVFIKSYCSCFMYVNAKQSIGLDMQLV